ncbi:MAG: ATP-binding cassette domain-containing protein [Spirochaetia bacterium]|jgi:phospholipid/cholesterol/gamma-HCH transport system ATP-binding protein|nr:ATP-binding cassette domain-containing protein [Spirochaetia bacterium]
MYDIYLKDITRIKNDRKIIDVVGAHFPKGKTTVVIGPSGSGKSTLLKVAAAILPVDSGEIFANDKNLIKMSPKNLLDFRKNSSFVFQDAALWSNKSVYQNMSLPLKQHFPEMDDKVHDGKITKILALAGYTDSIHLRPAAMSIGERKMVSLARALITSPGLIYMDNPLVLVDPAIEKIMRKLIIDIHNTSATIIGNFSSPELIKLIADYLVIIEDGKIVETGTFKSVNESKNPETSTIINSLLNHS